MEAFQISRTLARSCRRRGVLVDCRFGRGALMERPCTGCVSIRAASYLYVCVYIYIYVYLFYLCIYLFYLFILFIYVCNCLFTLYQYVHAYIYIYTYIVNLGELEHESRMILAGILYAEDKGHQGNHAPTFWFLLHIHRDYKGHEFSFADLCIWSQSYLGQQKVTRRKREHRSQCLPESRIVIPVLG